MHRIINVAGKISLILNIFDVSCHDQAILMIYFRTEVDKNYLAEPEVIILADFEKLLKKENVTHREHTALCLEVNLPPPS